MRRHGGKEGFFSDADTAPQGMHPVLVSMLRSELIREVSDGTCLPPTFPKRSNFDG